MPKLCVYCRNAESANDVFRGAGDPSFGANPTVKPLEAQALLALARQLTPQAYEREKGFAGFTPDTSSYCRARTGRCASRLSLRRRLCRPHI